MSRLSDPCRLGRKEIKNRLVRAATSERLAGSEGECTDELVAFLERLARHEVGTIITGHAFPEPAGRGNSHQLGVDRDERIPGLARLAAALHRYDAHVVLQVGHCGLFGHRSINGQGPGGPSVPSWIDTRTTRVRVYDETDIALAIQSFGAAARRALEAGMDGVQLRAGQGYLVHQFLSPRTNHRTDSWGGALAGRARFLVGCVREMVDKTYGEMPVWVQINVDDGVEDGVTFEEAVACARLVREAGGSVVELAAGTVERPETILRTVGAPESEAWSAWKVRPFREIEDLVLLATGGVRSPEIIDVLLQGKRLDLVGMARPFIREPDLALRLFRGLTPRCISVGRCARERSGLLRCRADAPPGGLEGIAGPID